MKIKVGMYAYVKGKSRDYGIGKIVNITEHGQGFKGDLIDIQFKHSKHAIPNQEVVASYSPIDLIQVGDYVNGHRVRVVYLDGKTKYIKLDNLHSVENNFSGVRTYESDIKSIVTHEQFEREKYVIGE